MKYDKTLSLKIGKIWFGVWKKTYCFPSTKNSSQARAQKDYKVDKKSDALLN